jgi:hypothetical protein
MKPRLENALGLLGEDATLQDVAELILGYPGPNDQPCLNPTCDEVCRWKQTAGRPKLFHSPQCRLAYERAQRSLVAEIRALERALKAPGQSHDRRPIQIALAKRRWALTRYPDVSRGSDQS